jgi:hypothetical protein
MIHSDENDYREYTHHRMNMKRNIIINVAYTKIRDVWKEMKWEYGKLDRDGTTEQVYAYLEELKLLYNKMVVSTNNYACTALENEHRRHLQTTQQSRTAYGTYIAKHFWNNRDCRTYF